MLTRTFNEDFSGLQVLLNLLYNVKPKHARIIASGHTPTKSKESSASYSTTIYTGKQHSHNKNC